jgi:HAD superfamily hydrolase (TIGR01509 family)
MKFAAVVFDLDGTIIKSEEEWDRSFAAVLGKLGIESGGRDPSMHGVSIKNRWRSLLLKYNIKTTKTIEELETLSYLEYQNLIPEITLNDGVLEFMDTIKESGRPLSLATSTNWETAQKVLEHFGLKNYFDNITTGEEVVNPKPAPDIFLLASEKLGVLPPDCLVIEDSVSGVTAAHDAGMKVIVVSDKKDAESFSDADLVVEGFPEITLKAIDAKGID